MDEETLSPIESEKEKSIALKHRDNMMATFGGIERLRPEEADFRFWVAEETNARTELDRLEALPAKERNKMETQATAEKLSYALVQQGRLEEATEILGRYALTRKHKASLQARQTAVIVEDDHFCGCVGDPHVSPDGTVSEAIVIPTLYVKKRVFSEKHEDYVYVIACTKCPHINATPILPAVLQQLAKVCGAAQIDRANNNNAKPVSDEMIHRSIAEV